LPGLHPLDIDEGIVEQAKFIGIHIIWRAELHNVSARMLNRACLLKGNHCGDGGTVQMDEPPGYFQDTLTEFQGFFGEPTFEHLLNGRQAAFEIKTDLNGKIPSLSQYHISPREEAELRRQIEKAIRCSWIQPSGKQFWLTGIIRATA